MRWREPVGWACTGVVQSASGGGVQGGTDSF